MLRVTGVAAGYGTGPDVITDVDLDVRRGEVVALLGPSGSGKSTLLRCIAGLQALRRGSVGIGGVDATTLPVERRGIGLVFQDHALLPHRDVAGNVGLGPRLQGLPAAEVAVRVADVLADVGLAGMAARPVDTLSGGEQQRVALARALAARPRLLLMDEPYGSLDRPLRERLLSDLPGLVRAAGAGAVLVTHDQHDALAAADRIAVLLGGRLRQLATPEVCWTRPADTDVARFLGVGPLFPVEARAGVVLPPWGGPPIPCAADGPATLLVPTARVRLAVERDPSVAGAIRLPVTVSGGRFAGDHHVLGFDLVGGRLDLRRPDRPEVPVGTAAELWIAAEDLVVLPDAPPTRATGQ